MQEVQNEWQDYAFPPVGTAKFVLGMSVIMFMTKVGTPMWFLTHTLLLE